MTRSTPANRLKRTALAVILTSFIGAAAAQSTTGSVYGTVPSSVGATVVVQSDSGLRRAATVDANGRYALGSLPVGRYTVTLQRDGQVVESRDNVQLIVGAGTEVSFGGRGGSARGDATTLGTVNVTAANIPKIDVSNTVSRSVITSEQLDVLPLGRSAEESIILLL